MEGTNQIPFALSGFEINGVTETEGAIIIEAHAIGKAACCPDCEEPSTRVHSLYSRIPSDLPSHGQTLRLKLHVKRFRCLNAACPRRTFVQRFPELLALHAQRTERLSETLRRLGLELGGEAGARISRVLGTPYSADTLLRIVRRTSLDESPPPRVLGVDDWAMRKGQRYGTILVDLERGRVLDLLPDREAQTLAAWLKEQPQVEIVSRDRAGAYAQGIQEGAPQAIQVADRWHLLKNLCDALSASYDRYQSLIRQVRFPREPAPSPPLSASAASAPEPEPAPPKRPPTAAELARQARRAYWEAKFQQVHELRQQGWGTNAIARELKLTRQTVRKYSRLSELPKRTSPKRSPRLIDPYRAYLFERVRTENLDSRQLWREIQAQGYRGGHTMVWRYVAQVRQDLNLPPLRGTRRQITSHPPQTSLTPRQLASLVICPPENLSESQQQLISAAIQLHPDIQQATCLAREFATMLRNRHPSGLDAWCQTVSASPHASLRSFVTGLQQDEAAVRAAFILPWSNGQVEGQVNRLKLIKRQMYGRAKFDLLRVRVLAPP